MSATPRVSPPPGWLSTLLPWLLLFALAAALAFQRIQSADYWWMLGTGRLIAETGAVPRFDIYTYTAPGARWVDIHWLFQLGLWGVYRLGGHAAVIVAKFGLVAFVLALLAPIGRRRERAWLSVAALTLLLFAACDRFMPRPEVLSWVLLAAVLLLLDRFERTGDRWVFTIVPVQLLWANVHGLFALGIGLCAMHLVGELARHLGDPTTRPRWERVRPLAAVTLLSIAAAFANPNGLDGALYPVQQLQMVSDADARGFFGRTIIELQPSFATLGPVALSCFLSLAALSAAALAANWRNVPLSDPLQWVAFFYVAIGARRNVPLFAIVAVPMLVRNANAWLDTRRLPRWLPRMAAVVLPLLLAALSFDAARGRLYPRMSQLRVPGFGIDPPLYAGAAADWLERHRPPGPIVHHMVDGGYFIWRLHPGYRVMMDGRLEVFGPELFEALAVDSPERFESLDAKYHFGAAVQRHDTGRSSELFAHLSSQPHWRLVAVDDAAALFVRSQPGEVFPYPLLDLDAPDLFPPSHGSRPERDELLLRRRTSFLLAVGRVDLALKSWRQLLRRFPDVEQGKRVRAALRAQLRAAEASPNAPDEAASGAGDSEP